MAKSASMREPSIIPKKVMPWLTMVPCVETLLTIIMARLCLSTMLTSCEKKGRCWFMLTTMTMLFVVQLIRLLVTDRFGPGRTLMPLCSCTSRLCTRSVMGQSSWHLIIVIRGVAVTVRYVDDSRVWLTFLNACPRSLLLWCRRLVIKLLYRARCESLGELG